jgi:hypothetical protein
MVAYGGERGRLVGVCWRVFIIGISRARPGGKPYRRRFPRLGARALAVRGLGLIRPAVWCRMAM